MAYPCTSFIPHKSEMHVKAYLSIPCKRGSIVLFQSSNVAILAERTWAAERSWIIRFCCLATANMASYVLLWKRRREVVEDLFAATRYVHKVEDFMLHMYTPLGVAVPYRSLEASLWAISLVSFPDPTAALSTLRSFGKVWKETMISWQLPKPAQDGGTTSWISPVELTKICVCLAFYSQLRTCNYMSLPSLLNCKKTWLLSEDRYPSLSRNPRASYSATLSP